MELREKFQKIYTWDEKDLEEQLKTLELYFFEDTDIPVINTSNTSSVLRWALKMVSDTFPRKVMDLIFLKENFTNNDIYLMATEAYNFFNPDIPYFLANYKFHTDEVLKINTAKIGHTKRKLTFIDQLIEVDKSFIPQREKLMLNYIDYCSKVKNGLYEYESEYTLYNHKNSDEYPLSFICFFELENLLSKEEHRQLVQSYCKRSSYFEDSLFGYFVEVLSEESMEYFAYLFEKKALYVNFRFLFDTISHLNWLPYSDKIWAHMDRYSMSEQVFAAKVLATNEKNALKQGKIYIKQKGQDMFLAFLTLVRLKSDEANDLVKMAFQNEKNNKVREAMKLTAVRKFYNKEMDFKEVQEVIQYAKKRGVLKKWKETFLEENLPSLHYKSGEQLNSDTIKFLFYRMQQIKTMESDPEAKLVLNLIDKSTSNEFALYILNEFFKAGSIAKQKYVMCLAGLLGDETLLVYLQKIFKELYEAKRMKMTQYVLGTIGLIGTDKALRFIEFVSRKYKKKAALKDAAIATLEIAAKELGIDIFELSDRIIPDFGFDGLYKTIDISGEEYRVFVAKNFKLQFINENNKVQKSIPKAASPSLKKELKTIQKEIREVNRAQKERLEQYMVLERRWNVEDWRKFYLFNPVMFIYATNLLWAIFDENENIIQLFSVDEDSSLLDIESDEIHILDAHFIGIVHPLRLSQEQQKTWLTHFYDLNIIQPFAQLDRASFLVLDDEKLKNAVQRYDGREAGSGPTAIQGYFERRGWRKEVSDGGCFDLTKTFKQEGIYAFLNVSGLCIGWYDSEVVFYDIKFYKIGQFNWKEGLELKSIPQIVFSEVIADMEGVKFKEKEKEE